MDDLDPRLDDSPAGLSPRRRRVALALVALSAVGLGVLLAGPAFGLREGSEPGPVDPVPDHPAALEMSVFSTPRTAADVLPPELAYRLVDDMGCERRSRENFGGCVGKGLGDESRLLLSNLGARKTKLWAWPTDTGAVCWAWDEGGGGCEVDWAFRELTGRRVGFIAVDVDELRAGEPTILVGVVPDDVAAVDVTVAGVLLPAAVSRNGMYFELPDSECALGDVEEIAVTYADGTLEKTPSDWTERRHAPKPGQCTP